MKHKQLNVIFTVLFAFLMLNISATVQIGKSQSGIKIPNITTQPPVAIKGVYNTTGHSNDFVISGNLLYLADGPYGLRILSIKDPTNPVDVGHLVTNGSANQISISGNILYLADGSNGLLIINITNSVSPTIIGRYDVGTSDKAVSVCVSNNVAYLGVTYNMIESVNVSNPAAPSGLDTLTSNDFQGTPERLEIQGDILYAAIGYGGVMAINITYPNYLSYDYGIYSLNYAKTLNINYDALGLAASGNFVYMAGNHNGLEILNVSQNTTLTNYININKIGSLNLTGSAKSVCISGDIAFVACSDSGNYQEDGSLTCVNITNPQSPTIIARLNRSIDEVSVQGLYAYCLNQSEITIIQVFSWVNPLSATDTLNNIGFVYNLDTVGNTAYVATNDSVIKSVDISDPYNLQVIGSYNTSGESRDISVMGSKAYVADGSGGLLILNVSNPRNMTYMGRYDMGGIVNKVVVVGTIAYISNRTTVALIDVSDASNPLLLSVVNASFTQVEDLVVDGNSLYVADNGSNTAVVSVSNPYNASVSMYFIGTPIRALTIYGNWLFASTYGEDYQNNIYNINISDPCYPFYISNGQSTHTSSIIQTDVSGDLMFATLTGDSYFDIFNMSNPDNVMYIGNVALNIDPAYGLKLHGLNVFIADGENGLVCVPVFYVNSGTFVVTNTVLNPPIEWPFLILAVGFAVIIILVPILISLSVAKRKQKKNVNGRNN